MFVNHLNLYYIFHSSIFSCSGHQPSDNRESFIHTIHNKQNNQLLSYQSRDCFLLSPLLTSAKVICRSIKKRFEDECRFNGSCVGDMKIDNLSANRYGCRLQMGFGVCEGDKLHFGSGYRWSIYMWNSKFMDCEREWRRE